MSASVELCVETAPFERIEADLAVAGFFLDERPLRGAAGRADWRLCGLVTELLENGRLRGRLGEATLVPSMGRLAADRVLLLGLGRRSSFRTGRARDTSHAAVSRGLDLGARVVVLAPPLGVPESLGRQASGIVRGAIEGARDATGVLRMSLALPPSMAREALESLEKAAGKDASDAIRWLGLSASARRAASPGVRRP
jgi:hypothetical protein